MGSQDSRRDNVISSTGNSAILPCVVNTDSTNYFLEWKKENIGTIYTYYFGTDRGQPAVGFEGRLSHGDDGSLTIHSVETGDAGVYWCVLKTFNRPADNQIGHKVNLAVQTAPYFISVPSEDLFREKGQSLSLFCKADGIPEPFISWSKGNGTIRTEGRFRTGDGKLEIAQLQQGDEGKYICTAENNVGSKAHATNLRFAQPAVFDEPLKNRTAIDASSLIWKCHARAIPNAVTYRWFYGEREVIYHESLGLRATVQFQGGDLRISKITREDRGWYKCAVSNGFGSPKISSAYLDIHYPPEISKLTPALQYIPVGLPAAVKCDVDASPPASDVTWTKDGRYVNPEKGDRISVRRNGTRLFIEQVEVVDEGLYTCQAFNYLGGGNNYEIHVFVEEPPYYVQEPAKQVTRKEGDEVSFECRAGGKIPPKVYWRRKNGKALPSRAETSGNKNLRIRDLKASDHGVYQCVVENRVTVLSRDSYLIIENTVPQAPENVTLDARAFDAEISWSPGYSGGASQSQSYTLKYRKAGQSQREWKTVYVKNGTRYMVTHLHPDTPYEFVIQPRNSLGPGFATQSIITKTKGAEEIGAVLPTDTSGRAYFPEIERPVGPRPHSPRNLVVTNKHHRVLFVWDPPASQNVRIQYYSVEYKENERYAEQRAIEPAGPSETKGFQQLRSQVRDTRLELLPGSGHPSIRSGETYDFRVKAHSIASFSDPSNTVTYTVPGVSSHMAVVAGIVGGVLFLLLFLLAGCFLVMRGRQKKKQTAKRGSNHAHSNGHTPYPNGNFDTLDMHYAKSDGSLDVSHKGVSGVARKIIKFFTGPKDSSMKISHSSQNSLSSDSFKSPDSMPSKYASSSQGPSDVACSTPSESLAQKDSELAEYLTTRAEKRQDISLESVGGLLKNFHTNASLSRASHKHVTFASDAAQSTDSARSVEFHPVGNSGYTFRVGTSEPSRKQKSPEQYNREKLLGTIDKLRQHAGDVTCNRNAVSRVFPEPHRQCNTMEPGLKRRQSFSSESPTDSPGCGGQKFLRNHPGRGAMRHSYSARGNRKRDLSQNQPVAKSHSSNVLGMRNQQIFNSYMNGDSGRDRAGSSSSSSGVTSLQNSSFPPQNGCVLPAVFEQTVPSLSVSSSSGISSDEGPGTNALGNSLCSPITEMLQQKYIFSQTATERVTNTGELMRSEEEERFRKLREEFRLVKGRNLPAEIKATVVESEVL